MPKALIVIDMQRGFDDLAYWGPTANPDCETNVEKLIAAWQASDDPIVIVHHDSNSPGSPLTPGTPGHELMPAIAAAPAALRVAKRTNSVFYGTPDLQAWLKGDGITELVICGIQTNMCVETTARMAGNLGYDVTVVLDATRTFDLSTDVPGIGTVHRTASELMDTTALDLQGGGFARIATTAQLIGAPG